MVARVRPGERGGAWGALVAIEEAGDGRHAWHGRQMGATVPLPPCSRRLGMTPIGLGQPFVEDGPKCTV